MNQKILMIAGIVFALVFIIAIAGILSGVINFSENMNRGISHLNEQIMESEFEIYNNTTVSGDRVVAAINRLKETKSGLKMSYAVYTTSGWQYYGHQGFSVNAGDDTVSFGSSVAYRSYNTGTQVTDAGFISPAKEYKSTIVMNKNGVVVGIAFGRDVVII